MAEKAIKKPLTQEELEQRKLAAEKEVDELVQKGLKALDEFSTFDQEKIDYIVAKNLKFSVMQSFASQAKTGSQDPHEMTRIHFQMLF